MYNSYYQNGVIIIPNVVAEGSTATVTYKGLLYDSGADEVYLHAGYGDRWNDSAYTRMQKSSDGFEAKLPITKYQEVSLAFKDSAGNWDNNSGNNYTFQVEAR